MMTNGKNDTLLLLPALNEEEALKALIPEIPKTLDVLVVDSLSTDRTKAVASGAGFAYVEVKYGRGQGSGVRTGMEYFLEHGYEYLIIADCDYTDDPKDLPHVLAYLKGENLDLVLGIRDFRKQREYLGQATILMKKTVSMLLWLLMGLKVRDMLTGVWAFNRKAVEVVTPQLKETGFEYGFEILYNAWKQKLKIGETDINFRQRIGSTKLTFSERFRQVGFGIKYGLKVVKVMLMG